MGSGSTWNYFTGKQTWNILWVGRLTIVFTCTSLRMLYSASTTLRTRRNNLEEERRKEKKREEKKEKEGTKKEEHKSPGYSIMVFAFLYTIIVFH